MPQQQTYADAPLTPDQVKAAGYVDRPLVSDHPWVTAYPKTATAARAIVNALPGIGGVLGGAIASPESAGLATVPGVALGVGAGRGLRDLIAEGLGLERPSSAMSKAGRITLDTGEAAAAQALLPALMEAIKTPGQTIREVAELLPAKFRPFIPKAYGQAPASILQRPAWQTWEPHIEPPGGPAPVTALSGQTGTAMTPTPLIRPAAAPTPVAAPAAAPVGPGAGAVPPSTAATAATSAALPKLTADETKLVISLTQKGATLAQAMEKVRALQALKASSAFSPLPSSAEVRTAVSTRNTSGRWDD